MARNTFMLFSISGILLVLFFMLMAAFAKTYSWVGGTEWAVFTAVVVLLVVFGLYKAFD